MLRTIGYGNKTPAVFFKEIEDLNPDLVVDVRDYPHKAFLGSYTKTGLEKRLGEKYLWLPVCGNVTRELPPTLRDEESCLKEIRKLMDVHGLIVLLCAEKDEQLCHRSYIREKVGGGSRVNGGLTSATEEVNEKMSDMYPDTKTWNPFAGFRARTRTPSLP